jgi:hypothetical protein
VIDKEKDYYTAQRNVDKDVKRLFNVIAMMPGRLYAVFNARVAIYDPHGRLSL